MIATSPRSSSGAGISSSRRNEATAPPPTRGESPPAPRPSAPPSWRSPRNRASKGICRGKMTFDDRAFDFIPWAKPLSDPRKARITVKQLLNHTSGICPEATGAPNDGSWEYILGHSGDAADRKAGLRSRDRLRLLHPRAGPRGAGLRDRHRQALRPVRDRGLVQAAGHRALVVPIL